MHRLMTARRPASAYLHARRVIGTSDQNAPARQLLLKMTLHAQTRIAGREHLRVDGAMGIVAGAATFAHGLMFKYKRAPLR